MSCYVCNRETFIKVLKAWSRNGEALSHMPSQSEVDEAWKAIVGANIDAFIERYEGRYVDEIQSDILECPPQASDLFALHYSKLELYDALKEYMYQVSSAENCYHMEGYFKCQWCLDEMLREYIEGERSQNKEEL